MSLYLNHRPTTLDQVKGNEKTITLLKSMLEDKESFPHTILLHGPSGCGKTTIGRIIGNELGCSGVDFREINTADFRGIDTSRDLIRQSQFMPVQSEVIVFMIDECHKLTNDAQNALLKVLEDAPKRVYFVLCTTDPQKLLATIKSRCSQFQVNPLDQSQLFALLRKIARDEGEQIDKELSDQIYEASNGQPRNAIQILEQILLVSEDERAGIIKKYEDNQAQINELCRALLKGEDWSKVKLIVSGLKDQEAETIRRAVLGYCQAVLLNGKNDRAALIIEEFWEPTYDVGFPYITYACYAVIKN